MCPCDFTLSCVIKSIRFLMTDFGLGFGSYGCMTYCISFSLGDGYTFPTRLVNTDTEQGNIEHQSIKW